MVSNNAEVVARWQQLLNGYSTRGGRGHPARTSNRGRQTGGSAGRDGLGPATDGYRQRDLHGSIQRNPEDFWGDRISPKEEHHLRIVFQNINRFPMHSNDPKNQSIRAFIKGVQADVIGMVELGICWSQLPTKDRIWERTRGWFESIKTVTAYNQKEASPNKAQWGGTSVWSIDNAVHRAIESGSDTIGLGRWSWTRYRGRGNITLYNYQCLSPL